MMGLLTKLFGRTRSAPSAPVDTPPCLHTTLVPKWDSTAAMGHEDQISGYTCEGCRHAFTPEQGRRLQRTEADRLKETLQT